VLVERRLVEGFVPELHGCTRSSTLDGYSKSEMSRRCTRSSLRRAPHDCTRRLQVDAITAPHLDVCDGSIVRMRPFRSQNCACDLEFWKVAIVKAQISGLGTGVPHPAGVVRRRQTSERRFASILVVSAESLCKLVAGPHQLKGDLALRDQARWLPRAPRIRRSMWRFCTAFFSAGHALSSRSCDREVVRSTRQQDSLANSVAVSSSASRLVK